MQPLQTLTGSNIWTSQSLLLFNMCRHHTRTALVIGDLLCAAVYRSHACLLSEEH